MTTAAKNHRMIWNSALWIMAMALPAFFYFALASTKFPWPIIVPLLLVGPMLLSNKFVAHADGRSEGA